MRHSIFGLALVINNVGANNECSYLACPFVVFLTDACTLLNKFSASVRVASLIVQTDFLRFFRLTASCRRSLLMTFNHCSIALSLLKLGISTTKVVF